MRWTDYALYGALALYLIGAAIASSDPAATRARVARCVRAHPARGDLDGRYRLDSDGRFAYTCRCGLPVVATACDWPEFPVACECGAVAWFRRTGRKEVAA